VCEEIGLLLPGEQAAERLELTDLCRRDHAASRPLPREASTFSGLQNAQAGATRRSARRAGVVAFGDARKLAEHVGDRVELIAREMLFEQRADRGDVGARRR